MQGPVQNSARNRAENNGAIWLHAVSVGEVLSSVTLARELKAAHPDRPLIVSTTTMTGQALARERLNFADGFLYFPLDWAFAVQRAVDAVKPAVVVIVETEIWPNFLRVCAKRNIPVAFVSGRISDRSFTRYQRYLSLVGFYLRPMLRKTLSFASVFLMQSESDAERIRELGAPANRVRVAGNLKYDLALPAPTPISKWLAGEAARLGRSPVIVAGSVVATEEPLALIAFGTLQGEYPKALLVLAPRKPERFDAAAQFIEDFHSKFVRRSTLDIPAPLQIASSNGNSAVQLESDVKVILLDSIGELASLYSVADHAFVGGSLVTSEATTFWSLRHSAKFPCLARRWKIFRRWQVVLSPRTPRFKFPARKMRGWRGLSWSASQSAGNSWARRPSVWWKKAAGPRSAPLRKSTSYWRLRARKCPDELAVVAALAADAAVSEAAVLAVRPDRTCASSRVRQRAVAAAAIPRRGRKRW